MKSKIENLVRSEIFEVESPSLILNTISSDTVVLESEDGRTFIEIYGDSEESRKLAQNTEIFSSGSKITVEVGKQKRGLKDLFSFNDGKISVIVRLPKTSTINVKAVSADIEVETTILNVDITTVSGDVKIGRNPTDKCKVKTVSGDVIANTFSGCEYILKSVSGDLTVNLVPGLEVEVEGKSVSGDLTSEISLDGVSDLDAPSLGTVLISASTVSGDFSLERN